MKLAIKWAFILSWFAERLDDVASSKCSPTLPSAFSLSLITKRSNLDEEGGLLSMTSHCMFIAKMNLTVYDCIPPQNSNRLRAPCVKGTSIQLLLQETVDPFDPNPTIPWFYIDKVLRCSKTNNNPFLFLPSYSNWVQSLLPLHLSSLHRSSSACWRWVLLIWKYLQEKQQMCDGGQLFLFSLQSIWGWRAAVSEMMLWQRISCIKTCWAIWASFQLWSCKLPGGKVRVQIVPLSIVHFPTLVRCWWLPG